MTQKQPLSQEVLAAVVTEVSQENPKQLCSPLAVVKEATLESLTFFIPQYIFKGGILSSLTSRAFLIFCV